MFGWTLSFSYVWSSFAAPRSQLLGLWDVSNSTILLHMTLVLPLKKSVFVKSFGEKTVVPRVSCLAGHAFDILLILF
jgi:hypothetical protein